MVALRFRKENSKNASMPLTQQSFGEPNKVAPKKTKEAKSEQGGFTSYFIKQGRR
jgi:hypothetical protein